MVSEKFRLYVAGSAVGLFMGGVGFGQFMTLALYEPERAKCFAVAGLCGLLGVASGMVLGCCMGAIEKRVKP